VFFLKTNTATLRKGPAIYNDDKPFILKGTRYNKTMGIDSNYLLEISTTHRLQWEEAQQKHVILYPEGMVELNQSSTEILKLCDGTRNLQRIVLDLEQKFETTGLANDVREFIEIALENGWIRQTPTE